MPELDHAAPPVRTARAPHRDLETLRALYLDYVDSRGGADDVLLADLRHGLGLTERELTLLRAYPDLAIPHRDKEKTFSDADLVAALRDVAGAASLSTITVSDYDVRRDDSHPSGATIRKRLGWDVALDLAGLDPRPRARVRPPVRRISTEASVAAVRLFLDDPETRRSANSYERWSVERPGLPSISTVCLRLERWNSAVRAAVALPPGAAEALLAGRTGVRPALLERSDLPGHHLVGTSRRR